MKEIIEQIQSLKGDPNFKPEYNVSQGYTAWRFSDLCKKQGYDFALRIANIVLDDPFTPRDCVLLDTFQKFLTLKTNQNENNS